MPLRAARSLGAVLLVGLLPAADASVEPRAHGRSASRPDLPPHCAMPPRPDGDSSLLLRLAREGKLHLPVADRGFFAARAAKKSATTEGPPPWLGNRQFAAILVQFPDKPLAGGYAGGVLPYFQSLLFGTTNAAGQPWTMRNYYYDNSFGGLTMNGTVFGPYVMPQPSTYYSAAAFGFGTYPNNAQGLTEHALNAFLAANSGFNWAPYDADADNQVDVLAVIHSGIGAESSNVPADIWSHFWVTSGGPISAGGGYTVEPYFQTPEFENFPQDLVVGVHAHEMGHGLGLPDLYGNTCPAAGVGQWTNMANGTWLGVPPGARPASLDPWCQISRGWVNPIVPTGNLPCTFLPSKEAPTPGVAVSPVIYKLTNSNLPSTEYFLVEARERIAWDEYLPGEGLLIWQVDEAMTGNGACLPVSCGTHPFERVVEADGDSDMLKTISGNLGDAADPFPGTGGNGSFGHTTTPNSHSWCASSDTLIAVHSPVAMAGGVRADLYVAATTGPGSPCASSTATPTLTATATALPSSTPGGPSDTSTPTWTASLTVTPVPCLLGFPLSAGGMSPVGGRIFASGFVLGSSMTVDVIHVFTNFAGASIQAGIYTDSGGVPDVLLAQSGLTPTFPGGWTALSIPITTLAPATYWLAFECDDANLTMFRRDTIQPGFSPGAGATTASRTFSVGLPSAFPPVVAVNLTRAYSVFATCQGVPSPTPTYSTFTATLTRTESATLTETPTQTPGVFHVFPNPAIGGEVVYVSGLSAVDGEVRLYTVAGEHLRTVSVPPPSYGAPVLWEPQTLAIPLTNPDGAALVPGIYVVAAYGVDKERARVAPFAVLRPAP